MLLQFPVVSSTAGSLDKQEEAGTSPVSESPSQPQYFPSNSSLRFNGWLAPAATGYIGPAAQLQYV